MEDAGCCQYGGDISTAQHLLDHMRQEYIEIVDEIAGECAFKFYDEVRRVVEQSKATAAARKPDTMTIISNHSPGQVKQACWRHPLPK